MCRVYSWPMVQIAHHAIGVSVGLGITKKSIRPLGSDALCLVVSNRVTLQLPLQPDPQCSRLQESPLKSQPPQPP